MNVVRATEEHVEQLQGWLEARGLRRYPPELLVGHGFAVDSLAACWIYTTGTPLVLLEHLVANPAVDAETRGRAIDAVVAAALSAARELGGRWVYAMTTRPSILERSRGHGFEVAIAGATMIAVDLCRSEGQS